MPETNRRYTDGFPSGMVESGLVRDRAASLAKRRCIVTPMKRPALPFPYLSGTLSLDQLARRWRTSRKEIRRLLARQQIGFVLISDRLRVPLEEVERYERDRRPTL
jgi:hypothetical protein